MVVAVVEPVQLEEMDLLQKVETAEMDLLFQLVLLDQQHQVTVKQDLQVGILQAVEQEECLQVEVVKLVEQVD
tara:strand:- start:137 stop:355 length:219 start_codon:yes stop_codon:yes gene_type:complete